MIFEPLSSHIKRDRESNVVQVACRVSLLTKHAIVKSLSNRAGYTLFGVKAL
jgi:hypothetical protein